MITSTLEGRIHKGKLLEQSFAMSPAMSVRTRAVQIIACGTSYHAGMVARYWLERDRHPRQVRGRQ